MISVVLHNNLHDTQHNSGRLMYDGFPSNATSTVTPDRWIWRVNRSACQMPAFGYSNSEGHLRSQGHLRSDQGSGRHKNYSSHSSKASEWG